MVDNLIKYDENVISQTCKSDSTYRCARSRATRGVSSVKGQTVTVDRVGGSKKSIVDKSNVINNRYTGCFIDFPHFFRCSYVTNHNVYQSSCVVIELGKMYCNLLKFFKYDGGAYVSHYMF